MNVGSGGAAPAALVAVVLQSLPSTTGTWQKSVAKSAQKQRLPCIYLTPHAYALIRQSAKKCENGSQTLRKRKIVSIEMIMQSVAHSLDNPSSHDFAMVRHLRSHSVTQASHGRLRIRMHRTHMRVRRKFFGLIHYKIGLRGEREWCAFRYICFDVGDIRLAPLKRILQSVPHNAISHWANNAHRVTVPSQPMQ